MKCDDIKELFLRADEPGDVMTDEIEEHIEKCKECRTFLEEFSEIEKIISDCAVSPEKEGVMLHEHIAERIANGDITPSLARKKQRFPIATVIAAAAILALAIVGTPLREVIYSVLPANTSSNENFATAMDFGGISSESVSDEEMHSYSAGSYNSGASEIFSEVQLLPKLDQKSESTADIFRFGF